VCCGFLSVCVILFDIVVALPPDKNRFAFQLNNNNDKNNDNVGLLLVKMTLRFSASTSLSSASYYLSRFTSTERPIDDMESRY
jgi:hypothetical protein